MSTAVSLNIPDNLNTRLEEIARRTGRSKDSFITDALNELLGDLEDLAIAEERSLALKEGRSSTVSQKEMERRYGLAD